MDNPACSTGEMVAALRGAADAKNGVNFKAKTEMSKEEQSHYISAYNRLSVQMDQKYLEASKSPLYLPLEFMSPSDLYGQKTIDRIDDIFNSSISTRNKQMVIKELGQQEIDKQVGFMKSPFARYIQSRIDHLNYQPTSYNLAGDTLAKVQQSFYTSWMKNNPATTFLHMTTGNIRLAAMDLDSGCQNLFKAIGETSKELPDFKSIRDLGMLQNADNIIHKIAVKTAALKYGIGNPELANAMVSKATFRYTKADTPGYMMLNHQETFNPFALSRFYIRDLVDPIGQLMNITRYGMGDKSPEMTAKAGLATKYLLGAGIMKSIVFGTGAALPGIINTVLSGTLWASHFLTGNNEQQKLQDWYKSLDDVLPTNLLYKTTGIDMSHHFERGLGLFVGPQAIIHAANTTTKNITSLSKSWQEGDMQNVGRHALGLAADILPGMYGLDKGNILPWFKDINILRLIRASGYAIGNEIDWNKVPNLVLQYTEGNPQALQTIKAQEGTTHE